MFDVVALGEAIIDFTPIGYSESGCKIIEANPGGSPCNMLAVLSKFGKNTAIIGKVGNDEFGHTLLKTFTDHGIDTSSLFIDKEVNTTLAFVHLASEGQRSFSFYRSPGADTMLNIDEVSEEKVCNTKVFHFSTVSMSDEPSRQATLKAIYLAKKHNILISFDPNLRPNLWKNFNTAKTMIRTGLSFSDIVKISNNELEFLYGKNDITKNGKRLQDEYKVKLLFVTRGKRGVVVLKDDIVIQQDGFELNSVDTTGAGDTFCGAVLYKILEKNKSIEQLTKNDCEEIALFANATAALSTTVRGGFLCAPTLNQVEEFIKNKS